MLGSSAQRQKSFASGLSKGTNLARLCSKKGTTSDENLSYVYGHRKQQNRG